MKPWHHALIAIGATVLLLLVCGCAYWIASTQPSEAEAAAIQKARIESAKAKAAESLKAAHAALAARREAERAAADANRPTWKFALKGNESRLVDLVADMPIGKRVVLYGGVRIRGMTDSEAKQYAYCLWFTEYDGEQKATGRGAEMFVPFGTNQSLAITASSDEKENVATGLRILVRVVRRGPSGNPELEVIDWQGFDDNGWQASGNSSLVGQALRYASF